jgi:hypothetical protein
MKKPLLIIAIAIIFVSSNAGSIPVDSKGNYITVPVDRNGYPVFNSTSLGSFSLENCTVDVFYYPMKGNISDRGSAGFVAEEPTRDQAMRFATTTPAFYFAIHINHNVSALVALVQHPQELPNQHFAFRIIRDPKKDAEFVPLPYADAVPDLRAKELKDGPWDSTASIVEKDGKTTFLYNYQSYNVLLLPTVVEDLKKIIQERKLYNS